MFADPLDSSFSLRQALPKQRYFEAHLVDALDLLEALGEGRDLDEEYLAGKGDHLGR